MSAPVDATGLDLLDHLTASEQHALFEHLQQRLQPVPLSQAEFEAALQAMTLDRQKRRTGTSALSLHTTTHH